MQSEFIKQVSESLISRLPEHKKRKLFSILSSGEIYNDLNVVILFYEYCLRNNKNPDNNLIDSILNSERVILTDGKMMLIDRIYEGKYDIDFSIKDIEQNLKEFRNKQITIIILGGRE